MAKDLFSTQAEQYAAFRPHYPEELYDYILSFVSNRQRAWDCGTGNGQAAAMLSRYFEVVEATDISEKQISQAEQKPNIHYHLAPAEHSPFPDNHFDLVTVATAYHWFDWSAFKKEVMRVGKSGSVLAVWAYHIIRTDDDRINSLIDHFYEKTVGPFWDLERKHIDERYQTIPFDFPRLPTHEFDIELSWDLRHFLGYLSTWSAVKHYREQLDADPIGIIGKELQGLWPEEQVRTVSFPVFLLLGRIKP